MDIKDNFDKEAFLVHMAEMLSYRDAMVILSVTGNSVETRMEAVMEAMRTGQHIWDDLTFVVKGELSGEPAKLDEDFQMWANELNN